MQLESTILTRLGHLLGVEADELRVRRLPGGISNRSVVVSTDRGKWVVRLPRTAAAPQTLNPGAEARLLALADEAELTPEVLAADAGTGALITRYLERAAAWTAEQAREPDNIKRMAAVLRRLHGLRAPPELRNYRPTLLAASYVEAARTAARADGGSTGLSGEQLRWSAEFVRLAQAHEAAFAPTAVCHNDLVAANILDDGQIRLVDFEYAVRADPILDLAGLAGLNGFDRTQRRHLLGAYFRADPAPVTAAQLDEAVRMVQLMACFWALTHAAGEASEDQRHFADAMAAMLR